MRDSRIQGIRRAFGRFETINIDGFITPLRHSETRKALRVAGITIPSEALTFELNYEVTGEPAETSYRNKERSKKKS